MHGALYCIQGYVPLRSRENVVTRIEIITISKNEMVWFYDAVMHTKDADGMANSVKPHQTAPEGAV